MEESGIVFIDEIDKICSSGAYRGADASAEGVQRDLLPLIEGSAVNTKYGNVNTDYILFVCSGAFHHSKPSDLLAELQVRVHPMQWYRRVFVIGCPHLTRYRSRLTDRAGPSADQGRAQGPLGRRHVQDPDGTRDEPD